MKIYSLLMLLLTMTDSFVLKETIKEILIIICSFNLFPSMGLLIAAVIPCAAVIGSEPQLQCNKECIVDIRQTIATIL